MAKSFAICFATIFFLVHVLYNNCRWPQNRPFSMGVYLHLCREKFFAWEIKWWINLHARVICDKCGKNKQILCSSEREKGSQPEIGIGLEKLGVRLTQIRKEFPLHPQINMWADQQFRLRRKKHCHIANDVAEILWWFCDKLLDVLLSSYSLHFFSNNLLSFFSSSSISHKSNK